MKKTIQTVKKALLWALLILLGAAFAVCMVYGIKGYQMYRAALAEAPLEQKVAAVREKEGYTQLNDLQEIYKNAVIAVEDHRFYSHCGVDPVAVARALWNDLRTWSLREGGSTITQQLAKNFYFPQSKKLERKIAEIFMAFRIERSYEKEEILELYINCIYYGSGYYSVRDAALGYFGKEPSQLNDYECTLLVGLPNAPSVYDPTVNPDLAAQRQMQVLNKMVRYHYLTQEEADEISRKKES